MKKCILCRKSLYQEISYHNIFRNDYFIHHKCEGLLNMTNTISFPFMEVLVHIHILFPSLNENPDKNQLFTKYGYTFFGNHEEEKKDSLFFLVDEKMRDVDFLLAAKLCSKALFLFTYTNEDFLMPVEE